MINPGPLEGTPQCLDYPTGTSVKTRYRIVHDVTLGTATVENLEVPNAVIREVKLRTGVIESCRAHGYGQQVLGVRWREFLPASADYRAKGWTWAAEMFVSTPPDGDRYALADFFLVDRFGKVVCYAHFDR